MHDAFLKSPIPEFAQMKIIYRTLHRTPNKPIKQTKGRSLKDLFRAGERAADAAWALYFVGQKAARVRQRKAREWALALSGEWLFDESRDTVGDGAKQSPCCCRTLATIDETPLRLGRKKDFCRQQIGTYERNKYQPQGRNGYAQQLVYNKLISGSFRRHLTTGLRGRSRG